MLTDQTIATLKSIGQQESKSTLKVIWILSLSVFVSSLIKINVGREGNTESWTCGGSASSALYVTCACFQIVVVHLISPLTMYSVLLLHPHPQKQKESHTTMASTASTTCAQAVGNLLHLASTDQTDSLFLKTGVLLLSLYDTTAYLLEVVGFDVVRFAPYALVYIGLIIVLDVNCFQGVATTEENNNVDEDEGGASNNDNGVNAVLTKKDPGEHKENKEQKKSPESTTTTTTTSSSTTTTTTTTNRILHNRVSSRFDSYTKTSTDDHTISAHEFSPMYAILFATIILSVPTGTMMFLSDVINRTNFECRFACEYNFTTSVIFGAVASFTQIALLMVIFVAGRAFGLRHAVLYGGIVRLMGDMLTALVLMDLTPFSNQYFVLLFVKFVGRLVLDLEWFMYFPLWVQQQCSVRCCRQSSGVPQPQKIPTVDALTETYHEQFELSHLSLYSESLSLSAVLLIFLSTLVFAQGDVACSTVEHCPTYQPVLHLDTFARFISCDSKMKDALLSYFLLWVVCGLR